MEANARVLTALRQHRYAERLHLVIDIEGAGAVAADAGNLILDGGVETMQFVRWIGNPLYG